MLAPITALALALAAAGCAAQPPPPAAPPGPAAAGAPAESSGYDAALARRLGADEYGMHRYVLALLKPGPNRAHAPEEAARLMRGHLANIVRLADEGSLVIAGPVLGGGALSGIYVFKVATVEEARALTATDPAIQAGRLEMELYPWYGSAALQEVNGLHKRLQQRSITD